MFMPINLTNIRIYNFKSLKNIDIKINRTNILIGQNNSGKSNLLKAINIALGSVRETSQSDIFISAEERISNTKTSIIDILIRPTDYNGKVEKTFSDFWTGVFTEDWITTDETNGNFVGIRTIIQYDIRKDDYIIVKKPIQEWNASIDNSVVGAKKSFGSDMADSLTAFYMDAHRDAVEDIKNRKSFFGKATSQSDLSDELTSQLEDQLNHINTEIIQSIPALQQTNRRMSSIGRTMGSSNSTVEIEPLARKISDLHKGMDIVYKDGTAAKFSIAQHGMGTRSWISFLTLGAYVDWNNEKIRLDDEEAENYIMLTMEEPEAHLHPQAQRQLYSEISKFNGQKMISTHSPSILAQANIGDVIHISKHEGVTSAKNFNIEQYNAEELKRIEREVINTRGELLFSNAVVLCEGVTEEQALPIFFREYFGIDPICCGINIIGIGGQNYKTFLNLIKDLDIPWFIFSDGEQSTIKTVKKAIGVETVDDLIAMSNIVILDNGNDYEKYLISEGYADTIISAINECEDDNNCFANYLISNNHKSAGRKKINEPICESCHQEIYKDIIRDYDGDDGLNSAIYDCCTGKKAKAKYATFVAEKIVTLEDTNERIPTKVKCLLKEIGRLLDLTEKEIYKENETIGEAGADCKSYRGCYSC